MRILVVGGGGREHALAWKLASDGHEVISAPGNPGMAKLGPTYPVGVGDFEGLASLATERAVDLTVIGPELPLVGGIADLFASRGLRVFGPSKAAAHIEGSKVFCREIAERYGVPMAQGGTFSEPDAAIDFARTFNGPIVVKADGPAAGKGVLICRDFQEAKDAIDQIMRGRVFGDSGSSVLVEEWLEGREMSMFAITDSDEKLILEPAQDYKRAHDGDQGLNTGGMGAYTPVPWLPPALRHQAIEQIVRPMIDGLASEGRPYLGCFYAGLIFTADGPRLIEVNCRFGDPETQALMLRLDSDLGELLDACVDGDLAGRKLQWRNDACVSVVVASGGYPEAYETGVAIEGIDEAEALDGVVVFHAGTAMKDGRLESAGGRVLNVSATASTIPAARERAYEAAGKIRMEGSYTRTDIASGV